MPGRTPFEAFSAFVNPLADALACTYRPYRVTTRAYDYSLRTSDHRGVIDYHWHPTGLSDETQPHIHLGTTQLAEDAVLAKA